MTTLLLLAWLAAPFEPPTYGPWRSCLIGGGGFMQNVVFTSRPEVVYSYADVAGPFRSDDGGRTWRFLCGGLPARDSRSIRGLLVDPRNPDRLTMATVCDWFAADTQHGLWTSDDGGQSWTLRRQLRWGNDDRGCGFVLARHPSQPDTLLAAADADGVWRSDDNGRTWRALGQRDLHPTDLRYDRADGRRVWLCAKAGQVWVENKQVKLAGGLYRSDDGGATFAKLLDDAPGELLQDPTDPHRLYGTFSDGRAIRVSGDGGTTWADLADGLDAPSDDWMTHLSALAAGPDFVLAATQRGQFFRLPAGQSRWQRVARLGVEEQYAGRPWYGAMGAGWQHFGSALGSISVDPRDPSHWFFTDWYAVYDTRDSGSHWRLSMDGIEVTVLHCLLQDPSDPGVVHLGMADNGHMVSESGGAWFEPSRVTSNMKQLALSPRLPTRVYGVGDGIGGKWQSNQVFVSIDRGRTWTRSPQEGLPDLKQRPANSIACSPEQPLTAYLAVSGQVAAGQGGVYRSDDGGRAWRWIGAGLPDGYFTSDIWVIGRELAAGPGGTLVAMSNGKWRVDWFDGTHWQPGAIALKGPPNAVWADPTTPGRLFLAARGDGVHRSVDGGRTWRRVLDQGANHVATDAVVPGRVVAGTATGPWLSLDGGDTWRLLDERLPYREHNLVALAGDRVVVGTHGAGAFWMPLSAAAAQPVTARPATPAALPDARLLPTLANGDMTQGEIAPAGWRVVWQGKGMLGLGRDTTTFQSPPSALRLSAAEPTAGSAGIALANASDRGFRLAAKVKADATLGPWQVAVQLFDSKWQQVGWVHLLNTTGGCDWREVSAVVRPPAGTTAASLVVTYDGTGSLWVDDAVVTPLPEVFATP